MEDIFTNIYSKNIWGGGSGGGSKISSHTQKYVDILYYILYEYDIKNICDIGCGDWEFSRFIDFSDFNYTGIDCVKSVIDENKNLYQKDNISFIHKTIGNNYIPEGYDLVILKDVIQHWTNEDILKWLPDILEKNKYVFITNGFKYMRKPENNNLKRDINNRYRYHPVDINKYPLIKFKDICLMSEEYFLKQMNLLHLK